VLPTEIEMAKDEKCVCDCCGWTGLESALLKGINPFDPEDEIYGCPQCKCVRSTVLGACMAADCWDVATCGTPTPDGYKRLCGKHYREVKS